MLTGEIGLAPAILIFAVTHVRKRFSILLTSASQITILKFALLIFHGIIHTSVACDARYIERMKKLKLVDAVMILLRGLHSVD